MKEVQKKFPQFRDISQEALQEGLAATQPCRLELIDSELVDNIKYDYKPKNIIFDVGHNPPALVIFI